MGDIRSWALAKGVYPVRLEFSILMALAVPNALAVCRRDPVQEFALESLATWCQHCTDISLSNFTNHQFNSQNLEHGLATFSLHLESFLPLL